MSEYRRRLMALTGCSLDMAIEIEELKAKYDVLQLEKAFGPLNYLHQATTAVALMNAQRKRAEKAYEYAKLLGAKVVRMDNGDVKIRWTLNITDDQFKTFIELMGL